MAVVDPSTNRLVGAIPLATEARATPFDPQGLVVCHNGVWVTDGGQQTLIRIDPAARRVERTIGIGRDVRTLACGFGSIWIADGELRRRHPSRPAHEPGGRDDPPRQPARRTEHGLRDHRWRERRLDDGRRRLGHRIDPSTNRVVERIHVPTIYSLAAGGRTVWVGTWVKRRTIFKLEPHGPHTTVATFATLAPSPGVGRMTVRGTALWVLAAMGTSELFEYDATTGEIVTVIDAGRTTPT